MTCHWCTNDKDKTKFCCGLHENFYKVFRHNLKVERWIPRRVYTEKELKHFEYIKMILQLKTN